MSLLRTTPDLLNDALKKAGEKTDGTSEFLSDALDYMNEVYRTIMAGGNIFDIDCGEPWSWARSRYPMAMVLQPVLETSGTLTQDSSNGTFTVAPTESQEGRYLRVTDRPEVYRIANHTAGQTAFTLDSAYADATGAGLSFKCIPLDYELPSTEIMRLAGPISVARSQSHNTTNDEGKIELIDLNRFERDFPMSKITSGVPTHCAIVHYADGLVVLRFNGYPAQKTRIEIPFIPFPEALTNEITSIPVLPEAHRTILSLGTAFYLCLDKEDTKAGDWGKLATQKLLAMKKAHNREQTMAGKNRGRLIARPDHFNTFGKVTSGS